MKLEIVQTGPIDVNTYILMDEESKEAVLIDVGGEFESIKKDIDEKGYKINFILNTHGHFDHILTLDEYVRLGAELVVSEQTDKVIRDSELNCFKRFFSRDVRYGGDATVVRDGDTLVFGDESITVIATPGHTAGSVCYLIGDSLFVGDTIFAGGGYGRYDLPTADGEELFRSIDKLMTLGDGLKVYPGHGEPTTILEFKKDYGKYRFWG